ncbi:MAG: InlB B-repeat-containing protein [Methanocorpusculum sp.]|nr:InlB B-repeat-containing protein [Methanocorpusculum sp.]
MKGETPAVFPKKRSVLLLAAVVLLVCCCLVVPVVAAEGPGTQEDPISVPEYGYIIQSGNLLGINETWLDTVAPSKDKVWLELKIPASINGHQVTQIARSTGSFNKNIGKDTSKKIAAGSRYQISSVDLSDAVHLTKIGSQAFMSRSEISGVITLPDSVEVLEKSVFNGCSGLTGVYLSSGLNQIGTTSSGSVFKDCTGLQFIRVTGNDESNGNFTLPSTLTTIGQQSFQNCFAASVSTSVTIPASVDTIGSQAFYSDAITTIFIERELANSHSDDYNNYHSDDYNNYNTNAFKASSYGPGKRLTIFPNSHYGWHFTATGTYGASLTYPLTLKFSGAETYNHQILYKQPINYAYNKETGEWEFDREYALPPVPDQGDTPRPGHTYGWAYGSGATAELLDINWKYTGAQNTVVTVSPIEVLAPPTIQPSIDGVALSQSGPPFRLTVSGGQRVGVSVTHPLAGTGDEEGSVSFKYEWTDVQAGKNGQRMSAEKELFGKEQDNPSISIRNTDDARYESGDFYYVEVYAYYHDSSTEKDTLYYKSHDAVIYFGSDQDTKATVSTVYRLYVTVVDPVVIEPVNLTIYANDNFPLPLYSGIPEDAVIKVNDTEWENNDYPYPFKIAYYNTTTNTPISKPDTPGIYNATIQPVSGVQLVQITIDGSPVTFRNGTLTVRHITDANETIPVAQQTRESDGISVSVPADTTYYLNNNTSLPVTRGNIHLLHDEILAGGVDTLKQIAPAHFEESSKYEMKYFDLIDTGNGHTWVSSSKDVTITWPYPEGTNENTEFTLLHYLDLHREYFTDEDLNSKTETVTVSRTGSGIQFSIPQSGFSPFALIWSDSTTHTVTFETYDGSQTQKVVKDGEPLSRPADPVREGYTFTGWYTDQDCDNPWDFRTPVTEDMTLYAGWKQNNPPSGGSSSDGNMDNAFRVLFNDGSTTLFVVTDLSYGDTVTKPEDPVKDGCTFAGWHKDAACTQLWDFADGILGDMTLYAKWTPVQTVTPTVTPTATVSVTPTVTAEPSGLPTTTPTVQPTGDDEDGKPAGSVLPLVGGVLILIFAVLLLLFLLLRHTVTFLIPTGGEITKHRIRVWHGRYIDPADLPELLRTAVWYRDAARRERWDFNEDCVTKSMELYLG